MKGFKELSAVAISLLAATIYAEDVSPPSDVHALKNENFESFIAENPLVLAEFYAPWCGHCKALAPEYEDAATKLKEKNIPLVKVDCTVETEVCEKQGVQGYPTVKVFRGMDNVSAYGGQRKSDAIVSYMIKQSLPAVSILDQKALEGFKKTDKVVIVAYIASDDKESNATYTAVAESLRDNYLFGASNDAAVAESEGVKAPALVLYKSFDEPKTVYDGKFTTEEITEFAKIASTPLVGEVGPDTYAGYMEAGIPLAYLFVDTEEVKEKFVAAMKPVAEKYKGKINFATIDAVQYGAHAQNLNLEQKWPAFAIQETVKSQKFPYDQEKEITAETIEKFAKDFLDGNLKPSIKSEPTPATQEGPVHVIVANNYEEIVMDKEKDVLVEYYAPWCGHCKNLAPKYEQLAAFYFNNKEFSSKVVVAKVDATANDVPVDIQGFPTIKLFPAGAKDAPVDYSGSRTVEDLSNFIKEHGTHKVDGYVAPPEEPADEKEEDDVVPEATEEFVPPPEEETASSSSTESAKESSSPASNSEKSEETHDEL